MIATIEKSRIAAPPGGAFLVEDVAADRVFTPEDFDDIHVQAKATTDRFMGEEVLPRIPEMERKEPGLARELIEKSAEIGLVGILVPERYEGLEMDVTTQMLVGERVGVYASFSTTYGAHTGIGTLPIVFFGTEDQKRRYLPRLVSTELLGAYCLSEPQAGSDSLASLTKAALSPDGRHYVLNGQKMWISNGAWADLYTVFAKVDGEKFTAFLVERAWDGVEPGAEEHKLGLHGSSTTALYLDNVKVPVENVLGEVGRGHVIAFNTLNLGRLELAAACAGGCKSLIGEAASYAAQRKAFGRTIDQFGAIRQKIADMAALAFATEAVVYRISGMIDAKLEGFDWGAPDAATTALKAAEEYALECSIAKVFASEAADFAADEALQIHGGYGYHQDYAVEREYRDSRINRIFEGTNEINRLLTTGMLLKRAATGRLDLMPAIARASAAAARERPAPPTDWELPAVRDVVRRAKRATLTTMGLAYVRFGKSLDREQEVCTAISDMCMAVFAAESCLLRAEKLRDAGRGGNARDIAAVFVSRSMAAVRESGNLVLGASCEPEELASSFQSFEALTSIAPPNLPAARDRIAGRIVETGGYVV